MSFVASRPSISHWVKAQEFHQQRKVMKELIANLGMVAEMHHLVRSVDRPDSTSTRKRRAHWRPRQRCGRCSRPQFCAVRTPIGSAQYFALIDYLFH